MIIFSPGPANITERVRRAMLLPDISHRGPEFAELLAEIRRPLLEACGVRDGYQSVVFTGSGTVAIEASVSAVRGLGPMLVVTNGVYGARATSIARHHGVAVEELTFPWGELPDPSTIGQRLDEGSFSSLYLVHHETTTGALNPLPQLAACARERGLPLLVDGISSVAGEELDLQGWGVDLLLGSANKCIRGVSGASFALVSERLLERIPAEEHVHYASLTAHLEAEERGETPFTPGVQVFYAFREALRELLEEGVVHRVQHYRELSRALRSELRELGLSLLLPEERYSNTMLSVGLPDGFDYATLNQALRERGFAIYEGQGPLRSEIFRLGLVGVISLEDVRRFGRALQDVREQGR